MDKTLAQNGLPELTLVAEETIKVGGQSQVVKSACDKLATYSENLSGFITQLETQKAEIIADWDGAAKDTFDTEFPGLISEFKKVPGAIDSLKDWATDVMAGYDKVDTETKQKLNKILGGAQ